VTLALDQKTGLNDCGCCEGISTETPAVIDNRPGLKAIAYRIGTHAQFKDTMLARLSASGLPPLARLTTRDDSDFSISLLDAWAVVADVLTFYQERIANELYLRTATERRSILELARLIGYELRPGVAASTYLAFTLDETPGALGQSSSLSKTAQSSPAPLPPVTIDIGTKVQSVPGPGETAQTFETIEKIEARAEWNAIRPLLVQPQQIEADPPRILLQGAALNLNPGDQFLIAGAAVKQATRVIADQEANTTEVDFADRPDRWPAYSFPDEPASAAGDFSAKTTLTEAVVTGIIGKAWESEVLAALAEVQGWSLSDLAGNIAKQTQPRTKNSPEVFVLRQRAAIFGYNAPDYQLLLASLHLKEPVPPPLEFFGDVFVESMTAIRTTRFTSDPTVFAYPSWENRTLADDNPPRTDQTRFIYLDAAYPAIVANSWIALITPEKEDPTILQVDETTIVSHRDFTISAKVSRLSFTLPEDVNLRDFPIRTTSVLAVSEQLTLADIPIEDTVPTQDPVSKDDQVILDRVYLGLKPGQTVILTGARSDLKGVTASEARSLKDVSVVAGFTVISFDRPLDYQYFRKQVSFSANVAAATHGETVKETLGSGKAIQRWQRFNLRQPPLTYVSAPTASGGQSTLEIRVDDVLWREVPDFYGHGPGERIYETRTDDNGNTTVIFGGGARPSTGQENVKAKYRKGIGLSGLVKADQLTQLMTRPLGVRGVTNPLPATGAADAETLDDARRNAPLTILTLGRIVSLQDYEDFARAFSGIDKALGTWTFSGESSGVYLTVAGSQGAAVDESSLLYSNLVKAIGLAGDPSVRFWVKSYRPRLFRVAAALKLDPDLLPDTVVQNVTGRLRDDFSFQARAFGQPVHLSDVVKTIQSVRGVIAVEMRALYLSDQASSLNQDLTASIPTPGNTILPAELLMLDSRPPSLEVLP